MLSYIKGILEDVDDKKIVIDANGIGFELLVYQSVLYQLPAIGQQIKLYVYLQILEDDRKLFGFSTKDEKELFEKLISVSGVGPKGACSILNQLGPDGVISAILTENDKAIAKSVGIGPKTAKKVVIELKDKVHGAITELPDNEEVLSDDSVISDVVAALCNLGYSNQESLKAVKRVKGAESMDLETLFSAALKQMI